MLSRQEGRVMRHLTNAHSVTAPAIILYRTAFCHLAGQVKVKAHDVRVFAAPKAFQSGISLEQIVSACHWKSHNTFTQLHLKDVVLADSELYHLGPVVAAQQIHH